MKILILVKQVVDTNYRVGLKEGRPDFSAVKMAMNPFDEIACEEAVSLKEKGVAESVAAMAIGPSKTKDVLLKALAMGADKAIFVQADEALTPLAQAEIAAEIAKQTASDVVITGKINPDDDEGFWAPMTAACLGWPILSNSHQLDFSDGKATSESYTDSGTLAESSPLPVVISADLRLANPRYVTLSSMMRARKKTIELRKADEFDVQAGEPLRVVSYTYPVKKGQVEFVDNISELVLKLKTEAKVL